MWRRALRSFSTPRVEEERPSRPTLNPADSVPHSATIQHRSIELTQFRDKCKGNLYIPLDLTDSQLVQLLNAADFDIEAAYNLAVAHFKLKHELMNVFTNRNPLAPEMQKMWETLNIALFPKLTPEGYCVGYFGLNDKDPNNFSTQHCMKLFNMAMEASLAMGRLNARYIFIVDCEGFTVRHLPLTQILELKKYMNYYQEAALTKLVKLIAIRVSTVMQKLYGVFRPFMSEDTVQMLTMHTNLEGLKDSLEPDLFPKELGGNIDDTILYYKSVLKNVTEEASSYLEFEESQRKNNEARIKSLKINKTYW